MDVIINSYTVNTGGTTDKHNLYKPLLEDTINRIINKANSIVFQNSIEFALLIGMPQSLMNQWISVVF